MTISGSFSVPAMPRILKPYFPAEVMKSCEAAEYADVHPATIRLWARRFGLGRVIGRDLLISRVAFQAFLEDEPEILAAYLAGDRHSPAIRALYSRLNIDLPAVQTVAAE